MALPLSLNPSYHAYTCGCEAAEEQSLELIFKLSQCFNGNYPAYPLAFMLRKFNPRLLLQANAETGRRNWPWLSDEILNAVDSKCRQSISMATPAHQAALDALPFCLIPQGLAAAYAAAVVCAAS